MGSWRVEHDFATEQQRRKQAGSMKYHAGRFKVFCLINPKSVQSHVHFLLAALYFSVHCDKFSSLYWKLDVFFFFNFIFKLYHIVLVLPNIEMDLPQVYMCSPSWTLLPPPSPYHPSGSSQCTSPKHPVSCIEPGLAYSFHTWYYTCFNAILPNLPTLSLSHRVHKTILYISVSFAVSYTGLLLPSF